MLRTTINFKNRETPLLCIKANGLADTLLKTIPNHLFRLCNLMADIVIVTVNVAKFMLMY